ncbi:acetate kinase [Lactobacillus sp. DCY120]|uniref:Acetate kinase n=1 Tax=Bombilactobacillus apium TaxID=2675299 RepID=A0A850R407_9LACO|nr:acetate kinase [Bombilactobacillus apium]NVY97100.1 acetate kinase [Bombilactobacillus apium]
MTKKILVVNSGSSTLKFKLFELPAEKVLAKGMVDRLGIDHSVFELSYQDQKNKIEQPIKSHEEAVSLLVEQLVKSGIINDIHELAGIGHRVVSGGPFFKDSVVLDETNLNKLAQIDDYAPLHNPAERKGIGAFAKMLPDVPQVAVFDTSFYQNLPKVNQIYSIPKEYTEKFSARRYGAHGTSHTYVTHQAAKFLGVDYDQLRMISLHMGSGVSITAVQNGQAIDTSMGFTPLAGVTMSSRAGDIDTSLVAFLMNKLQINDINEMITILNSQSGLKGISGISPDMRDLIAARDTNPDAQLAIEVFVNRLIKYVGSYLTEMAGVDVMIFTAGMGENNPAIRKSVMEHFAFLGMKVDDQANENGHGARKITTADSKITALVIPTDEELVIAHEFERLVK